jgi:hypothetical protein
MVKKKAATKAPRAKSKVASTPIDAKTQLKEKRDALKANRELLRGYKADLADEKKALRLSAAAVKKAERVVAAQAKVVDKQAAALKK